MTRLTDTSPWRSRSLAGVLAGLALLPMSFTAAVVDPAAKPASAQPPDDRPNVLIIMTDDQRDGMAVMPKTRAHFEEAGRRYANGFVTTPQCCPARTSLMTGRYAHNHGLTTNELSANIPSDEMLQAQLQRAGYRTALFGKYLNALPLASNPPNFDEFAVSKGYENVRWNVNGFTSELPGYNTDLLADHAVDFIRAGAATGRPWMMMLNPYGPHAPYRPEAKYADAPVPRISASAAAKESDLSDKPGWIKRADDPWDPDGKRIQRQQFRTLLSVDDMVDRVMNELAAAGETNTIAVFTSDNGYLWGEHGYIGKGVPYTEAVRVPFYIRWPGRLKPGSVDWRIVANIDLAPTILKALELPVGERDGRDLFDATMRRDRLQLEYWCKPRACRRWASTRTKSYQYVEHYDDYGNVTFREYYDLKADPAQLRNLLRDGTSRNNPPIAPLSAQLQADRTCVGTACP